jgi:hypothetical protein
MTLWGAFAVSGVLYFLWLIATDEEDGCWK